MSAEIDVLEQMVRRSHSRDTEVRNAALKQILELPDEALLQLLANYSKRTGVTGKRMLDRTFRALPYVAFALAIVVALSKDPSANPLLKWAPVWLGVGALALALVLVGSSLRSTKLRSHRKGEHSQDSGPLPFALVLLLAGRTDPRFLPYLLSEIGAEFTLFERTRANTDLLPPSLPLGTVFSGMASMKPDHFHALSEIRQRYRRLLKGMLTQIGPEDEIEISSEQRQALLLLLQIPEEDVDLTVGILAHLEQWGEARTVPALKRLIREEHWYVGSDRVEAAARRCLEQIEARLHLQKQRSTLLRPTQNLDALPPRSLLRPAANPPEHAPEQLLRSENSPPPDNLR